MLSRPESKSLIGKDSKIVPMSCQRIFGSLEKGEHFWVGPDNAAKVTEKDAEQYELAHTIIRHLAIQAPLKHASGHPGGPLSAFTFSYALSKRRNPQVDQPLRISAGHLSLLSYGLQWLFGRSGKDARLVSPDSIIDTFRTANGLPGHIEAGIGDIPFGTGPLGKGVSNALGAAYGLKIQNKKGIADVLMADGDSQEGQNMEAFRLASHLELDNLVVHGDINDIQLSGLPTNTVAADIAALAHAAGWHVIEVQNGNNLAQVNAALDIVDSLQGKKRPIFVCYYTTMGDGISLMEKGSNSGAKNYHGSPLSQEEATEALSELEPLADAVKAYEPFRKAEEKKYTSGTPTITDVELTWNAQKLKGYTRTVSADKGAARKDFGATHIKALMKADERIIVLHADLAGSGGFDKAEKEFPTRVINVGVAEANMYMMAAGMRQTGLLPVTYTFAAFGTNEARANARLIDINSGHTRVAVLHDCTHSGLSVGEDGETHQERNYLAIPLDHTEVWTTADSNQAAAMAEKAFEKVAEGHTSVYTFFPRDNHEQLKSPTGDVIYGKEYVFDGKIDLVRGTGGTGDKATIIACGMTTHAAIAAADALLADVKPLQVRVLNVACVRPIDSATIAQAAFETGHLIVVEDHHSEGGLASQVADIIADFAIPCTLRRMGVNHYFPSAKAEDLYFLAGIDAESIQDAVLDEVRAEVAGGEDVLVSALYEMVHNANHSRFRESIIPFVEKLHSEKNYLETLREFWKNRGLTADRLPENAVLKEKLAELA